jgi:hypothetical protein
MPKMPRAVPFPMCCVAAVVLSACPVSGHDEPDSLINLYLSSVSIQMDMDDHSPIGTVELSRYRVLHNYGIFVLDAAGIGVGAEWIDSSFLSIR